MFTAEVIELYNLIRCDTFAEEVHIDSDKVLFGVESEEVLVIVKFFGDLRELDALELTWSVFYLQLAVQNND